MKRSFILVAVVVGIFAAAVGLRLRSHYVRTHASPAAEIGPASQPALVDPPRDYVAAPWVCPEEIGRGPGRIVSLAPSVTEIVCALGLRDRLVGRTQFCRHPPGVEAVPAVGALMDTNFEKIRSLAPDLVLATANSGQVIDGLRELGIRCVAVPHDSLEEVYEAIARIGDLCERPRTAGALVACVRADVRRLQKDARALNLPARKVLVVLGELPASPRPVWVAGPGSFLDSLVQLAGQTNAAAGAVRTSHAELPLEKLLALDVDVILTFGPEPSDRQWSEIYQGWSQVGALRAIRDRQVRWVGGAEWLSAGPRIAVALHRLTSVLPPGG